MSGSAFDALQKQAVRVESDGAAGMAASVAQLASLEQGGSPTEATSDKTMMFEREVLACCMKDSSVIGEVVQEGLRETDFSVDTHRRVFSVLISLDASGTPIDPVTVTGALERESPKSWSSLVADIATNSLASVKNVSHYATTIRDQGRRRQAIEMIGGLTSRIATDGIASIDSVIQDLMSLTINEATASLSLRDALSQSVGYLEDVMDLDGELPGVPTGLEGLDEATGGWRDSDFIVIGARPAMGKTAFLLNSAMGAATRAGKRGPAHAGIISTEQPASQLGLRCISIRGRLSATHLRQPLKMTNEDWSKVTYAIQEMSSYPVWINESSSLTIDDIFRQARHWKHHNKLDILFVDYIQRIKPDNERANRSEQVAQIASGLKSIAKNLKIPVVALSQVRREVEDRPNKRPMMADFKESSAIEQEADLMFTLYRDEVYNEETLDKGIAEIAACKNRHGEVGVPIRARWEGKYLTFRDYDPAEGVYENLNRH
ncbi:MULTISPECIES: replicative DNA helicase [unclassified Thioalkalivibrio]|uniref:replicative DNA helicase n=1 Tax=unclassified Thioalkalivibrio TaxID=2621013 RepID=UPI00036D8F8C|nr:MULTISPECIES: replicative DNA helicase [unclassified Thioalkalivibrio]